MLANIVHAPNAGIVLYDDGRVAGFIRNIDERIGDLALSEHPMLIVLVWMTSRLILLESSVDQVAR